MKRKICVIICAVLLLSGCATIPRYWSLGEEGYSSPEGITTRTAVKAVAQPLVGEPWSDILSHITALILGGYAVHKRRQLLDTPTKTENPS